MRLGYKFIAFAFIAILTAFAGEAFAAKRTPKEVPLSQLIKKTKFKDAAGKKFICAYIKTPKGWYSGSINKRRKKFIIDKAIIEQLSKRSILTKKEKKQIAAFKARHKLCRDNKGVMPLSQPTPTPVPAYGPPQTFDSNHTGRGIEPVAIDLNVASAVDGLAVECKIVGGPSSGTVEFFPNCKALAAPKDHRSPRITFQFVAQYAGDSRESPPATVNIDWDQSEPFSGDYHSMASYSESLRSNEAMQLIRWVNLGKDRDKLLAIAEGKNGLDNMLGAIFGTPQQDCAAIEAEAMNLAAMDFTYASRNFLVVKDLNGDGIPDEYNSDGSPKKINITYTAPTTNKEYWTARSAQGYWIYLLRNGCQPVRERLALLLHNHFPLDLTMFSGGFLARDKYIPEYLDFIRNKDNRPNATGFMSLERIISKLHSIAGMINYLQNTNVWYSHTNENYPREFMELFLLSESDLVTAAKNYEQKDVFNMTYALTGHFEEYVNDSRIQQLMSCRVGIDPGCHAYNQYRYNEQLSELRAGFDENRWNDVNRPRDVTLFAGFPFEKSYHFKSNSLIEGGDDLTPYVMYQHPGAARYLAARLIVSFAGLELSDETLSAMADQLKSNGYELLPTIKRILSSSSFFSQQAQNDCIAAPPETFISFINLLDLPLTRTSNRDLYFLLALIFEKAGQNLLVTPNIFGWRECGKITGGKIHNGVYWLNSQLWLERLKGITSLLNDLNYVRTAIDFNWNVLLPGGADQRDPDKIISRFSYLLGIDLTVNERVLIREYLENAALGLLSDGNPNLPKKVDPAKVRFIDLRSLTPAQFDQYWSLKGPGLIELFFSLKRNHTK